MAILPVSLYSGSDHLDLFTQEFWDSRYRSANRIRDAVMRAIRRATYALEGVANLLRTSARRILNAASTEMCPVNNRTHLGTWGPSHRDLLRGRFVGRRRP